MIGRQVSSVARSPTAALLWLGTASAVVGGLAAAGSPALGFLLAVLPAAVGGALLALRDAPLHLRFHADALEVTPPGKRLRYDQITEVWPALAPSATVRPGAFAIDVAYRGGRLRVPSALNVPSDRVYTFLRDQVRTAPAVLVADLALYRQQQSEAFGPERVFTYAARPRAFRHVGEGVRRAGLAILSTGGVWVAAVATPYADWGWALAGIVALLIGGVLLLEDWRARTGRGAPAVPPGNGMVLSPVGLALHQGELVGHVKWAEVRSVDLRRNAATFGFTVGHQPALVVSVQGAEIPIRDVYDRPLTEIHQQISQYWR